jgi:hypothetical protein
MKRIRIIHKTEYFYNQPGTFGPHRAMMRRLVRDTMSIS